MIQSFALEKVGGKAEPARFTVAASVRDLAENNRLRSRCEWRNVRQQAIPVDF